MSRRDRLIDLARFSEKVEVEFLAGLTPQERQAVGAADDWAAKDLVGHVMTWRERSAEELNAAKVGPLPAELQEFDEVNRSIFDQNHSLPWDAIQPRARKAWEAFARALAGLNDERLDAGSGHGSSDRPLWRRVTVEAGNHPVLHYTEFARRHGRVQQATQWMEGAVPLLQAVDSSAEWHGVVDYNLACHYAQSGMPDSALESLRKALDLNPGLAEWSTQDSDLASLHDDPRFASIAKPRS